VKDDLGTEVAVPAPPARVVSLVPSLTEAVAATVPECLVGATDYCSHPADLDVPRVGGSKYPTLARILALRPQLVLANVEENRREDVGALRAAGVAVWVTYPRTVDSALDSLRRMLAVLGVAQSPPWLNAASSAWAGSWYGRGLAGGRQHREPRRAVIPVWRRPWVVVGSGTFAGDVLRRLGVGNVFDQSAERYPRPALDEILAARPELVVLPDEPYPFGAQDGPEAFPGLPCALVSGRHLTWYGPSLAEAPQVLRAQLDAAS
jgi:ABC-type Fe3+-hydroxamate transport system substrate-binding protein